MKVSSEKVRRALWRVVGSRRLEYGAKEKEIIGLIRAIGFEKFFSLVADFEGVRVGLGDTMPFVVTVVGPERRVVLVLVGPTEGAVSEGEELGGGHGLRNG
jgi:hypothetical protein